MPRILEVGSEILLLGTSLMYTVFIFDIQVYRYLPTYGTYLNDDCHSYMYMYDTVYSYTAQESLGNPSKRGGDC